MPRPNSMLVIASISLVALAGLVCLIVSQSRSGNPYSETGRPLRVYCAAALKAPMQAIAAEYERETGRHVEFEFGDSGAMLGSVTLRADGDLFLPADDSFVRIAQERGRVAETIPLCRMRAVILTRHGNPFHIETFADLLKPELKVGIANPDKAAIGKVVKSYLTKTGKWEVLARHITAQQITVTDSANAVQLGSIDAAIVWDTVAANYPELVTIRVPELDGAVGRVELAVLISSADPHAGKLFASYIAASDRGMVQFRKAGFTDLEPGPAWVGTGGSP